MTPDPIGLEGGINLYAYSESNPINKLDPHGLSTTTIGAGIGSLAGPAGAVIGATIGTAIGLWMIHEMSSNDGEVYVTPEGIVIVIPSTDPTIIKWCKEEIDAAENMCIDFFQHPDSGVPKGVCGPGGRGGWRGIEDCVKGNIPEICGGNPVH